MTHDMKCPKCNRKLTFIYNAKCVLDLNDNDFIESFDVNENTTLKQMRELITTNDANIYYCESCEMHVITQNSEMC